MEVRFNGGLWDGFSPGGVVFIVSFPSQKWSTVPFTRALKYYIPLGDISIVAWPSSLKKEAYGMGE